MTTQPNEPAALILRAADTPFTDAVVLGQGLPLEKEGHKITYRWKESLPLGTWRDKHGKEFTVTPQRLGSLIDNFQKAKAKGWLPPILDRHEKTGSTNYGYIVDARKNAKGNLELLHQLIGEDALLASARNGTSICTVSNVTDETGEKFPELIDHQAIVPDPQLNGLADFTPAIAASRGPAVQAVVLELAADDSRSQDMDITPLRKAIGAADDLTPEKVIEQAITKLGTLATATTDLQLSRTAVGVKDSELTGMRARAEKAEQKVLELSKDAPDQSFLGRWAKLTERRIDQVLSEGKCSKAQADTLKSALKDGDQYDALMLSRSETDNSPLDLTLKILELNRPFVTGQQTTAQPVGRQVPGASGVDHAAEGRAAGDAYQKQQLAARGVTAA